MEKPRRTFKSAKIRKEKTLKKKMKSTKAKHPIKRGEKPICQLKSKLGNKRENPKRNLELRAKHEKSWDGHENENLRVEARFAEGNESKLEREKLLDLGSRKNRFNEVEERKSIWDDEKVGNPFLTASIKSPTNLERESNKNIFRSRVSRDFKEGKIIAID